MLPWDAYDMLFAIAQMHDRTEKHKRNDANLSGQDDANDSEYSVDVLFPLNSEVRGLYERLKYLILSLDSSLEEASRQNYVAFKKGKSNTVCLWPKDGWIEVVLNAKLGQLSDGNDLIYDISNRKWSAAQYAFKYYDTTEPEYVKDIIGQTLALKK